MKLSPLHTAQAARQLDSWVVPETHPANPSLCETFGDHTFFLDSEGLVIAEPSEAENAAELARVVKLAAWADEDAHRIGAASARGDRAADRAQRSGLKRAASPRSGRAVEQDWESLYWGP